MAPNRRFGINMSHPKTVWEESAVGWVKEVGFAGGVPQSLGKSGHRITPRYSVERGVGGAQEKQPSGGRMGKLKVAVYGERTLADSANGLKRGKGSIQGPAILPMRPISSLHILLMEVLAVPIQKISLFISSCGGVPSGMIGSLLARRLAYYNLMTEAQHTEQREMGTLERIVIIADQAP